MDGQKPAMTPSRPKSKKKKKTRKKTRKKKEEKGRERKKETKKTRFNIFTACVIVRSVVPVDRKTQNRDTVAVRKRKQNERGKKNQKSED